MGNTAFSLAGSHALQVLLGTGLVIGLLLAFLWVLRRYVQGTPAMRAQRRIQVLEAHSLGPRQRLVLVRVDGHDLLLGLTGSDLRPLWSQRAGIAAGEAAPRAEAERARRHADVEAPARAAHTGPRWASANREDGPARDWVSVQ